MKNNANEQKVNANLGCASEAIAKHDEAFVSSLYEQDLEFCDVGFKDSALTQTIKAA